jgi:hypothetical protein
MAQNFSKHGPHRTALANAADASLSNRLDPESREAHDLLEALDDAMFEAIDGNEASLARAHELWQRAVDAVGGERVEESREQYLRFAVETTKRCAAGEVREPAKMLAAAEVIAWLTRGAA